jgi:hypothetical protein
MQHYDRSEPEHFSQSVWWASLSRQERREFNRARNQAGRTWVAGRHSITGRRALSGGEGAVQPELGRVPGLLERKLSPGERKAFASEVEALRNAPRDLSYSYFKWQDIPVEVRREITLARSWAARTWVYGRTAYQMDVPLAAARELYNANCSHYLKDWSRWCRRACCFLVR